MSAKAEGERETYRDHLVQVGVGEEGDRVALRSGRRLVVARGKDDSVDGGFEDLSEASAEGSGGSA